MKQQQQSSHISQQRIFRLIKFFLVLLIIVFILEIWVVNRLATYGKQIQNIKYIQNNLILENQVLENTIAQKMSLSQIEQRAGKLGFFSNDQN